KYHGKLRGAIVMNGRPIPRDIGFRPEARRFTGEELKEQAGQIDPASGSNAPKSYWGAENEWKKTVAEQGGVLKFFSAEGVAALVTFSDINEAVRVGGFYDNAWRPVYPGFVFSREHYGRIVRLLEKKQPVKLSLSLAARFTDNVEGFNVVAEIPGTDAAVR